MNARFRSAASSSSSSIDRRGKPAPWGAGEASRALGVETTFDVLFWLWLWHAIVEPLAEPLAEPRHFDTAPLRPEADLSSANLCLLNLSASSLV
jgi:hypothetical protein